MWRGLYLLSYPFQLQTKVNPGDAERGLSQPAVFWMAFIEFRRPLERDGFWAAVYYIDGLNFMMAS